ncbi:hypothetical protein D3C81_1004900 [compost metagenome]
MFRVGDINVSLTLASQALLVLAAFALALFARNSMELKLKFKPNLRYAAFIAGLFVFSILYFNQVSEFLYFTF